MLNPHGMDPQTVLRFVKYVGGWPGRVLVVACEPECVEDVGLGLSAAVRAVGRTRRRTSCSRRIDELRARCMSCRWPTAILDTALRHADGRPVTLVSLRVGSLRQVVPDSLRFYFEIVAARTVCDGARLQISEIDGAPAAARPAAVSGT